MEAVKDESSAVNEMEESEEDTSSEDTEEEEVEPKLCYERIVNDVPNILRKDAASCISVHPKFLALGTHLGVIHILDHQGNNIRNKELLLHVTTVNQISIDEKGDYIASCSNDGKIAIHGLYSSDFNTSVTIERPVRSVAIDPNFSKSSGNRRFIVGEDKVVLYERHILTGYKPNVLYQGEGAIRNLKWKERFLVWASDKTVRVYDINSGRTITVIQKDHDPLLRSDLYRCNLHWKDDRTLLIGWANTVKVCQVVPSEGPKASLTSLKDQTGPPRFYVKITSIFSTDFYICGISSLGAAIVVLTVKKTEEPVSIGSRPQLRVLESHGESYTSILSDTLVLRGYQEYRCNDYHLESLSEEGLYFILSLKDFVVAKPRNDDDHIMWLLEHDRFKEALKAVSESKNCRIYTLLDVGNIYLNHLFELRQYNEAAELCGTIFGKNKDVWETGVYRFAELGQLRVIAPHVPTDDLVLVPAIYEMILNEFLQYDQKGFLDLVRSWPSHVYDVPTIITVVLEQLALFPESKLLLESLSELYIYDKKFDKAFNVLIEIGSKDRIFKLIQNHNLFGNVHDKLDTLMELNPSAATGMLLSNVEKVPVNLVVSKLKNKNHLLYEYLHKAFLKDPTLGEEHHGLLVELYAEYAPELLLPFLRMSHNYSLEFALDICQQRSLIHEVVFLLGRMGNTKQALQQITGQLQDIDQAIQFCKEHDDKELWEDLIESSLDKPSFITVLLQNIGTHVDPIMLIQKIPNGMEIPGLRDSLVKILHDYTLQVSLREGCKKILVADCHSLLEKLNKLQKRGILVNENQVCPLCERKLFTNDSRIGGDIIVFNCKHAFHEDCVPVMHLQKWETCTICSAQKRGTPGNS